MAHMSLACSEMFAVLGIWDALVPFKKRSRFLFFSFSRDESSPSSYFLRAVHSIISIL